MSLSPLFGLVFGGAEEGASTQLPVREGDLLFAFEPSVFIPILASDADSLDLEVVENVVTLAGMAVTLVVDTAEGSDWLRNATPLEMATLRWISIDSHLNPETLSLLERLASHNPELSLTIDDKEHLPLLLGLFDPGALLLDATIEREHEVLLAREEGLETLMISGSGVSNLDFLTQLPNLETLFLTGWDPEETGPLPDSLGTLRSVIVFEGELETLAALGTQLHLEELTLTFCDEGSNSETLDLTALANHPDLETLSLRFCPTVVDLSALGGLPALEWLALPESTTQEQFEEVVLSHPGLIVLDLVAPEGITDLTPLTGLTKLRALLVGDVAPPDPLYGMDDLEYLAVVVEEEDSTLVGEDVFARLQAELPETVVARVEPLEFCLGSGFILLLFPMVGGAWWMFGRRRRGRRPAQHHA